MLNNKSKEKTKNIIKNHINTYEDMGELDENRTDKKLYTCLEEEIFLKSHVH